MDGSNATERGTTSGSSVVVQPRHIVIESLEVEVLVGQRVDDQGARRFEKRRCLGDGADQIRARRNFRT